MRWYLKILLGALLMSALSVSSFAQSDLCASGAKETSDQARVEQMRQQAAREAERRSWEIKMFPFKNPLDSGRSNFGALCIFKIEVYVQPAVKLLQVRAPKELLPAIEEAIKTLDVPSPPPAVQRGVEITAYVLVASTVADPKWMPVPRELQSVADQLKSILPNDPVYLADTVVSRGIDNYPIMVSGDTRFKATIRVRSGGAKPAVGLENLDVQSNGGGFNTSIDVPVGTQVVVGRAATPAFTAVPGGPVPPPNANAMKRTLLLVISAKLLD